MIVLADDIALLRPFWLASLPLILVLAVLVRRRYAQLGEWSRRIDPHLMAAMERLGRVGRAGGAGATLAPFLAAGLICLGLLGPAVKRGDGASFRNLDGVIYVMDISRSMTEDETWQDVVTLARSGLNVLGSRPAALIVYGGDSYEAAALTTDHLQLGQTMSLLEAGTMPDAGSRPALALRQAASVLARSDILAADVVLFSDGAGFGPEAVAAGRSIADRGARLIVVQVPTTVSGDIRPDAGAWSALANAGPATFLRLEDFERLTALLAEDAGKRLDRQEFGLAFWTDHGRLLLIPALLALIGLFRREAT
ncbi:VWA domain-containing protein [Sedimentitalea sp. JM2-8]|uniref:VWA domain-containing protein n=1 Tax=Sedimentitalea xiamensis TaxID=3050037 RepID=A0ABT7FJV5_9RHOB|nr:VWA domain-containing protein [Sedimentitalea xiamensis]MDK3075315.1 VWA domain-containing protein [Sedimentitalea xiamensis]